MKKNVADERIYTAPEVIKLLGVSRPTLIKRITDGELKAFKVGRQWRITEQALKEFMKPE